MCVLISPPPPSIHPSIHSLHMAGRGASCRTRRCSTRPQQNQPSLPPDEPEPSLPIPPLFVHASLLLPCLPILSVSSGVEWSYMRQPPPEATRTTTPVKRVHLVTRTAVAKAKDINAFVHSLTSSTNSLQLLWWLGVGSVLSVLRSLCVCVCVRACVCAPSELQAEQQ
jgi:hypothetical protein